MRRKGVRMLRVLRLSVAEGVCAVLALVSVACMESPSTPDTQAASAEGSAQAQMERGLELVAIGGCHDCHTPKRIGPNGPEPDMDRMLSGHPEDLPVTALYVPAPDSPWAYGATTDLTAWGGPWGVSFSANLTPDTNTGLRSGVWTEELFIQAFRTGKHMGTARDILPPMPWQALGQLDDDDLKAIWGYLGTIPAVANHVPDPIPPAGPPAS